MENIFDTSVLVQVVPNLKTSQNWLLDRFFPNVVTYETEEVAIDVDVGLRRMAPFVSPLVEGKLVESRKYQTNTFKPAYIKDKRAPDLRKPIRRQIGERIGGEYTAAEREMLNLQFEMTDQIDMINRRLEWMAASALVSGTVSASIFRSNPCLLSRTTGSAFAAPSRASHCLKRVLKYLTIFSGVAV